MVGKIESEQAGGLADVVPLHQQTFRLIDYIIMYVTDSRATSGLVDDVAKITRRIGQFGSAPSDGRQTLHHLTVLTKIGLKQVVKALQQVSLSPVLFEKLALIDIPVSGADKPAARFGVKVNLRASATLVASVSPVA